jgi:hypothetical protein
MGIDNKRNKSTSTLKAYSRSDWFFFYIESCQYPMFYTNCFIYNMCFFQQTISHMRKRVTEWSHCVAHQWSYDHIHEYMNIMLASMFFRPNRILTVELHRNFFYILFFQEKTLGDISFKLETKIMKSEICDEINKNKPKLCKAAR